MTTEAASPANRLATLPPGLPELTLGWEAVRFAVKFLRHPNGPRVGQRWEFVDSQLRFLLWWYAVDEHGRWLFHHGVRRLAKGSGKSPFAALVALTELCAPVRLRHFDADAPGGCVGMSVAMPLVQIAATAESQTANTMRMVRAFAPKHSRIVQEFSLDPGKVKYYKQPEGTLEIITSSATAAEGAESTFVVADETEHWKPSNGGPDLYATLLDNLTKSGSRMLETSNAWVPGQDCVAETSYDAWLAQEEGRTRGTSHILYDARIAPPDTRLDDPESLQRGLEFVYGDCWWQGIRPVMERIWDPKSRPDDSMRKYLNRPTVAEDAWISPVEWAALVDTTRVVTDDEEIVLFFDGSRSRDATALVGCCMSDGHVFAVDIWEPDARHDTTDVVPVADVDLAVRRAFERYNVLAFFADVKEWEGFVKVNWPTEFASGLIVKAVPTGKMPEPIAWDMRSHEKDFTMAAELCETEIREAQFTHDGDSRMARHIANARRRPNRWGVSIGKESANSPHKIDAAVCVIGARMVRKIALAAPRKPLPCKAVGF